MKQIKKLINFIFKNKYIFLSLLLPILIIFLAYLYNGIPFKKSILIMDGSKQYVDFFSYYYDIFKEGHSFFYSFTKGLGGDLFSLLTYYVISPLSLILLLFPKTHLVEGIFVLSVLKIGLSGLTFAIYLKKSYKQNNIYTLIFSILYALIGYSVVYLMSLMWIDAVIMLPLIALGIERIIDKNKNILFIVSLTIVLMSNYYTGYMLCIFSMLYYIYYYLKNHDLRKYWDLFLSAFKMGLRIILCVLLACIILVPTYFGLKSGKMAFDISNFKFSYNFFFFDFIGKMMIGAYDTIKTGGLPNVYIGLLPLALIIMYLLNKRYTYKDKILFIFFVFILYISMAANPINLIWHGFQPPIWFPYRYSFVLSFLLIKIAYDSFINMDNLSKKDISKSFVILFIVIIVSTILSLIIGRGEFFLNTIISLFVLFIYMVLLHNQKRKLVPYLLLLTVSLELLFNSAINIKGLDKEFRYDSNDEYSGFINKYQGVIDEIYSSDNTFFRLEKNFSRSHNDNMSLNNRGVSNFSSIYHAESNSFLSNLGYLQVQYWVNYNNGSSIISDSLLGVKYVLSKNRSYPYYQIKGQSEDVIVYENPYALSLGYLVDKDVALPEKTVNHFEYQNYVLNLFSDENERYFSSAKVIKININNLMEVGTKKYKIVDKNKDNYIEFVVESSNDELYAFFDKLNRSNAEVYVNDVYYQTMIDQDGNFINTIYTGRKTTSIKVKLTNTNSYIIDPLFYNLDFDKTISSLSKIKSNQLNITSYGDNYINGTINSYGDKVLMTTIPYEKGWSVKVNGKEVETLNVMGTFLGCNLEDGLNEVEFSYTSYGFEYGKKISIGALLILFIFLTYEHIYNKKNSVKDN